MIESSDFKHLVTHCDYNYLPRALVLLDSIARTSKSYSVTFVCHDDLTFSKMQSESLNNIHLVKLSEIELYFPQLVARKMQITPLEYIFLITPFIVKFCLEKLELPSVAYVDSDICFFSSIDPIFKEINKSDVGITAHNFLMKLTHLSINGTYNVGIVFFRNTQKGLLTVNWWADRCMESTSIHSNSSEIFGDQKYLDSFSNIYPETHVYQNFGINAAPWNCDDVSLDTAGKVFSNGHELVCFHFSGLKSNKNRFILGFQRYNIKPSVNLRKCIYQPYALKLYEMNRSLESSGDILNLRDKVRIYLRALVYRDFLILPR